MKKHINEEDFKSLLTDIRELTETNCHGEALERIATFFEDKQLASAFEAINTLHLIIGYLDSPIAQLRQTFASELYARIEYCHGEQIKMEIYNGL